MMNKENLHEWISRYTDDELEEPELKQFQQRLASDPEVRKEVALDRELTEFLQDGDLLEFLDVLDQARSARRPGFGLSCLMIAALVAALVALTGFWIYLSPVFGKWPVSSGRLLCHAASHKPGPAGHMAPSIRRPSGFRLSGDTGEEHDPGLLAGGFKPLTYLEAWVGVTTRSVTFSLIAPGPSITVLRGDTIRFRWSNQGIGSLGFILLNNRGEPIDSRKGIEGMTLNLLTNSLDEGLYYWKFMDREELLRVGKIIIRR